MYKLNSIYVDYYYTSKQKRSHLISLMEHMRWLDVWKIMNQIKPIRLIPGLNMVTIYQIAEYFEVPLRLIKNIEKKYRIDDPFGRRYVQNDEFCFLALNKKQVTFEGVQHWQYDFKDFSIHTAASGVICYSPQLMESFIPYIDESEVCSKIVCELIKKFDFNNKGYLQLNMLLRDFKAYEEAKNKKAIQKEQERATEKVVKKVLANMNIDSKNPTAILEVAINIQ